MKKHIYNFIDLFSGAGGFSLGFEREGFKCIGAIDNDINVIKIWNNKTNLAQLRAFTLCKGLSINNSSDQAFIGLSNLFNEILIKFFKVCIKPPLQKIFIENS